MLSSTKLNTGEYRNEQYENPFADSTVDPFQDNNAYIEPDLDLTGQSTTTQSPLPTGNIGQSIRSNNIQYHAATYSGEDTLDEPVTVTISRDLKKVGNKLLQVLHPKGDRQVLRDWDLWGPLLLCLTLAIVLSLRAPDNQAVAIFTGVFVIVWLGAAIVTINAKMLGGAVSFFQSVCVIGYCLFPIVVSAIIAVFVGFIWIRLPVSIITFAWSTYASVGFMSDSQVNLQNRRALAVYPLFLFYFVISWLVLIS
ncbi:Yip1 domain-containing protein [Cokeromyces recurvatus]|uniref:Yip1 domain-containing protein n=1 Tax=Cokeromyces recurvatus TaxID=90255 RepID=UPI00221E53E7|nr:Yip1 domain-containing protein [Cokeromyces recurvatus]KAI7907626.1 Yip1 domain-containing protein [Cokeromyces recurvatus]